MRQLKKMRVGFRADANEYIATGHLMRCMAIAEKLRRFGAECIFFLAEEKCTDRLQEHGFSCVILHGLWNSLTQELPVFRSYILREKLDWLVVDSYQADNQYLSSLNQLTPVLYLDDMAKEAYGVQALLHYSAWPEEKASYIKRYADFPVQILFGTKYVPLREEFYPALEKLPFLQKGAGDAQKETDFLDMAGKRQGKTDRRKALRIRVLLTTGGTDPYHILADMLDYWALSNDTVLMQKTEPGTDNAEKKEKAGSHENIGDQENTAVSEGMKAFIRLLEFDVIVGTMNPEEYKQSLEQRAKKYPEIHLYENVKAMGERMRACDLAVSAGGTTLYELCACAVPTVCFSFVDNQADFVKEMAKHQIMLCAGDARSQEALADQIYQRLFQYFCDFELTKAYMQNMQKLADGKGAGRIAEFLAGGNQNGM